MRPRWPVSHLPPGPMRAHLHLPAGLHGSVHRLGRPVSLFAGGGSRGGPDRCSDGRFRARAAQCEGTDLSPHKGQWAPLGTWSEFAGLPPLPSDVDSGPQAPPAPSLPSMRRVPEILLRREAVVGRDGRQTRPAALKGAPLLLTHHDPFPLDGLDHRPQWHPDQHHR